MIIKKVAVAIALQVITGTALAGAEWSYEGSTGPAYWGALDPAYATCSSGAAQSPINVIGNFAATGAALGTSYGYKTNDIVNNGHTVQVGFPPGNFLNIEGVAFELKQVHFHAASEHQISGTSYPLEAHFVHASSQGNLAVIGVMFSSGTSNPSLQKLWNQMPAAGSGTVTLSAINQVLPTQLMPSNKEHYRYGGSLTTPPCSEGVRWHVMRHTLTASSAQITAFKNAIHGGFNNRPLQPLNGRTILKGTLQ